MKYYDTQDIIIEEYPSLMYASVRDIKGNLVKQKYFFCTKKQALIKFKQYLRGLYELR